MTEKAERLAMLKARYEEKLSRRMAELVDLADLCGTHRLDAEAAAAARFVAHDIAGSGALFGFAKEGARAAAVEETVLEAARAVRGLTPEEARMFLAAVAALQETWLRGVSAGDSAPDPPVRWVRTVSR